MAAKLTEFKTSGFDDFKKLILNLTELKLY